MVTLARGLRRHDARGRALAGSGKMAYRKRRRPTWWHAACGWRHTDSFDGECNDPQVSRLCNVARACERSLCPAPIRFDAAEHNAVRHAGRHAIAIAIGDAVAGAFCHSISIFRSDRADGTASCRRHEPMPEPDRRRQRQVPAGRAGRNHGQRRRRGHQRTTCGLDTVMLRALLVAGQATYETSRPCFCCVVTGVRT